MHVEIKATPKTMRLIDKFQDPRVVKMAKHAGLETASRIFRLKAVKEAPNRKGTLRKSILTEVNENQARIYSDLDYAVWQEEGTGIYGKKGSPIRPRKAKYLRFKTKGGKIVFAKKVKGTKGKFFFKKAGEHTKKRFSYINKAIRTVLIEALQ